MYSKGRKLYIKAIARVLVCALVIAGIFAVFMGTDAEAAPGAIKVYFYYPDGQLIEERDYSTGDSIVAPVNPVLHDYAMKYTFKEWALRTDGPGDVIEDSDILRDMYTTLEHANYGGEYTELDAEFNSQLNNGHIEFEARYDRDNIIYQYKLYDMDGITLLYSFDDGAEYAGNIENSFSAPNNIPGMVFDHWVAIKPLNEAYGVWYQDGADLDKPVVMSYRPVYIPMSPSPTALPSLTPTPTALPSPTLSPSPSVSPTVPVTPSISPTPSVTPTVSPTASVPATPDNGPDGGSKPDIDNSGEEIADGDNPTAILPDTAPGIEKTSEPLAPWQNMSEVSDDNSGDRLALTHLGVAAMSSSDEGHMLKTDADMDDTIDELEGVIISVVIIRYIFIAIAIFAIVCMLILPFVPIILDKPIIFHGVIDAPEDSGIRYSIPEGDECGVTWQTLFENWRLTSEVKTDILSSVERTILPPKARMTIDFLDDYGASRSYEGRANEARLFRILENEGHRYTRIEIMGITIAKSRY